jgi:hypothetical protein
MKPTCQPHRRNHLLELDSRRFHFPAIDTGNKEEKNWIKVFIDSPFDLTKRTESFLHPQKWSGFTPLS